MNGSSFPTRGLPFFEGLFADNAGVPVASQLVSAEVQRVEGVTSVEVVQATLHLATRRLRLELTVGTEDGQLTISEDV